MAKKLTAGMTKEGYLPPRPAHRGPCIKWPGSCPRDGYPQIRNNGRKVNVTRFLTKAESNEVVDHLCRNKWCVSPAHLERTTISENTKRGVLGYVSPNCRRCGLRDFYYYVDGNGRNRRNCRECIRRHKRKPEVNAKLNAYRNAWRRERRLHGRPSAGAANRTEIQVKG